jgi:DNA-binding NarL/FixJ family response regulator
MTSDPVPAGAVPDDSGRIRVALVDDQQLVRAGFRMVIDSQPDLEVVLEAGDGLQALRLLADHPVDVVLMDVRMPHLDGLSATAQLTGAAGSAHTGSAPAVAPSSGTSDQSATPRVIVLTTFDLDEYVLEAIRSGASGFLLKDAPPEEMLAAIRTVHRGDAVIAPSSTRRLLEHLVTALPAEPATPQHEALASLTEREREVLVHMARGRSNTEIAADLYVAEATVKTHVGRILAKLGARDRVQAVVTAYETGLVRPGA